MDNQLYGHAYMCMSFKLISFAHLGQVISMDSFKYKFMNHPTYTKLINFTSTHIT